MKSEAAHSGLDFTHSGLDFTHSGLDFTHSGLDFTVLSVMEQSIVMERSSRLSCLDQLGQLMRSRLLTDEIET